MGRWLCLVDHAGEHFASCVYEPDRPADRCICDRDTLINDPGMTVPGCPVHDSSASTETHETRKRG